jgi:hypothetical protein
VDVIGEVGARVFELKDGSCSRSQPRVAVGEGRSGGLDAVGITLTGEEADGVAAVHEASSDREHRDGVPGDGQEQTSTDAMTGS